MKNEAEREESHSDSHLLPSNTVRTEIASRVGFYTAKTHNYGLKEAQLSSF